MTKSGGKFEYKLLLFVCENRNEYINTISIGTFSYSMLLFI